MSYPYPPSSTSPLFQGMSPYEEDPYADMYEGDMQPPQRSEMTEDQMYPDEDESGTLPPMGYARGGRVEDSAPLSPLAEMLKGQGRHGDTMLAHINPLEAMMLKSMGGSGTINPKTGLPEYFFGGIGRFFKKVLGPVGGAILGNMILPGAGALIGGGIGGMFGHPNQRMGPLAGAGMGAFAPMAMGGLGNLISGAGATGAGGLLNSLAGQTANPLTSFLTPGMVSGSGAPSPFSLSSLINGGNAAASTPFSMNPVAQLSSTLAPKGASSSPSFLASLLEGAGVKGATTGSQAGSFLGQFLQPQNALSTLMVGNSLLNPPPSVERQAKAQYRAQAEAQKYLDDQLHEPDRMRQRAKLDRELEREKWEPLAETADDVETEQLSPEEYERTGKWFRKYKKNPQGQRIEVPYARGGEVRRYLDGNTGGQEDKIPAWLSDGEYVMDANTVSALGDGNNTAGAQRLDEFRKRLLKHKGMKGFPPKTKPLTSYLH